MRIETPRVLTKDEAAEMMGGAVPRLEPTVTEETIAVDPETGQTVFAYLKAGERQAVAELRRAVLGIKGWGEVRRAGTGDSTRSRTFGLSPRKPTQLREGCNFSALAQDQPDVHAVIDAWATRMERQIRSVDASIPDASLEATKEILPEWRIGESGFWTSGVINKTAVLPYHRDRFNFPTWSAMPVLRRGVSGGYLHIPEYGAVLACRDGWAAHFCGFDLVHGVTPMRIEHADGYRYSIVYYALRGMKDCFTAAEETARGARMRTERERSIADRIVNGTSLLDDPRAKPAKKKADQQ